MGLTQVSGGGGRTGTDPPASSPDRTAKYFRKYRYLTMYVPGIQRFMEDPKTEELKLPIFGGFCFWLLAFRLLVAFGFWAAFGFWQLLGFGSL